MTERQKECMEILISGEYTVEERREAMHEMEKDGEETTELLLKRMEEIVQLDRPEPDDAYTLLLAMWYLAYKKESRAFQFLLDLSLKEALLNEIPENVCESYPYVLYYTYNGDYDALEKMILTPGRETYAEIALLVAATDLCRDEKVDREKFKITLFKLIDSSYREDEVVMEYVCMAIAVIPLPEMMFLAKALIDQGIASTCYIDDYEECEKILREPMRILKDLFLPRADPYPLYQELEYLDPECFL